MSKRRVYSAIFAVVALVSSCSSETNSSDRIRNSTLKPSILNGQFASGVPGWVGSGFALGRGCASNTSSATRPSLGEWKANSLAFGSRQATVTQSVIVPEPSLLTFTITGAVRTDDLGGWFVVNLADRDEDVSTGRKTGAEVTSPSPYTLNVATTSPNESVTISLTGSGKKNWKGCYGPILSNATLRLSPTVASTVEGTSTTSSPRLVGSNSCLIALSGSTLEACQPFAKYSIQFFNAAGPVSAVRSVQRAGASKTATFKPDPRADSAVVSITFKDGSTVQGVKISFGSEVTVEFTQMGITQGKPTSTTAVSTTTSPSASCRISYDGNTIRVCRPFASYSAQLFDNNEAVSGTYSGTSTSPTMSIIRPAENRATAVVVSFTFADGSTINRQKVVIGQAIDAPYATPATLPTAAASCSVSVYPDTVKACERISRSTYQWWDDSQALSGQLSNSPNSTNFYLGPSTPGTKRIRITLQFSNGTSVGPFFVPFNGKTFKSVTVPFNTK